MRLIGFVGLIGFIGFVGLIGFIGLRVTSRTTIESSEGLGFVGNCLTSTPAATQLTGQVAASANSMNWLGEKSL